MKPIKAKLLRCSVTKEIYVRIYDSKYLKGFKDFDLYHDALEILIVDTDIKINEDHNYIDHSDERYK